MDSASHSAYLADDRGARVGGVRVVLGRSAKRLPVWRVPVLSLAAFVGRDDRVCTSLLAENCRFGVLLAIAGTATVVGEWQALLAFLLMLINYTITARKEDQILADRLTRNSSTTRIVVGFSCRAFGCVEVTRLSLF